MSLHIRIVDPETPPPRGLWANAVRAFVMFGVWALVAIAGVAAAWWLLT
jgi:hypothetical protein